MIDTASINTEPLSEATPETFIHELGLKVLEARKKIKMSRRVLSEKSGVSQRTIVLLETGTGNISVGLLYRVAEALDQDIAWLVSHGEDALGYRVATRFNETTPEVQERVLSLLLPEQSAVKKRQRICLIGLRGAGKSTLGRLLSQSLSLPFFELNREIEALGGMSVPELMSLYGQEGYRRLEFQALEKLVDTDGPLLFATAGGVVSAPDTYKLLLENFYTIWLKASPQEHLDRVIRQGDTRLIPRESSSAMEELKSILTDREVLYSAADFMVDTSGQTVEKVLERLLTIVSGLQPTLRHQ